MKTTPIPNKVLSHIKRNSAFYSIVAIILATIALYGFISRNVAALTLISIAFPFANATLLWLYNKGKKIPTVIGFFGWTIPIVLLIVAFANSINNIGGGRGFAIPIILGCLCVINYRLTIPYYKKWNVSDILFKKIVPIGVLGVIISLLQLIIAIPQLQLAYKSVSQDDVAEFKKSIEQFNSHVASFIFVDIPDSLQNEDVLVARKYQKQIYTYSLSIINADWDIEAKPNIGAIKDAASDPMEQRQIITAPIAKMMNVLGRIQTNFNVAQNLYTTLLETSSRYVYGSKHDSLLISSQIKISELKAIRNFQDTLSVLQSDFEKQLRIAATKINIEMDSQISDKRKNNLLLREVETICESYNDYLNGSTFNNYIKSIDKVCLDYINFLNIVQLEYAYNVNLTLKEKK